MFWVFVEELVRVTGEVYSRKDFLMAFHEAAMGLGGQQSKPFHEGSGHEGSADVAEQLDAGTGLI
jgi:hypothetical protein